MLQILDVIQVLGKLHSAHRKLLRAQQASLWVCLEKLGNSSLQLNRFNHNMKNLNEDISSKHQVGITAHNYVVVVQLYKYWGSGSQVEQFSMV